MWAPPRPGLQVCIGAGKGADGRGGGLGGAGGPGAGVAPPGILTPHLGLRAAPVTIAGPCPVPFTHS